METAPQQPTGREDTISALNAAIATLDLARNNSNVGTAKNIFRSATDILTTARVRFFLFRDDQVQAHSRLGLDSDDQKTGSR